MSLFVCTGNTCRSPMAAALARARGVDAASAGLYAVSGAAAAPQAVRAAAEMGGSLKEHRARPVTEELMASASAVYAMTDGQAEELLRRFPRWEGKIRALTPPVPDPFGGDDALYRRCAQRIWTALQNAGILGPSPR